MSKIKRTRTLLISLGCCCIIAAAALAVYNYLSDSNAGAEADKLTASFSQLLDEARATNTPDPSAVDPGLEWLPTQSETTEGEIKTLTIGELDICGSLSLPTLGINLAIISDWSYPKLAVSACRYSGTPEGQMIIMAHNYQSHFGRLTELSAGDTVSFTDADGTVYDYQVFATETWATDQLYEIISGDWDLTLFTCTYGGASRVVVRCDLI